MKRTRNLWNSLEAIPSLAAVLAEWKDETGPDFERVKAFLRPTQEQATSYRCTNVPRCNCEHEVVIHSQQLIVAACRCGAGDCPAIKLSRADLMIYRFDGAKLGEAVRVAFGFAPSICGVNYAARRSLRIGTIGPRNYDVYLVLGCEDEDCLLREVEGLLDGGAEPFIVITGTRRLYTPMVYGVMKRAGCTLLPLSMAATFARRGRGWQLKAIEPDGVTAPGIRPIVKSSGLKIIGDYKVIRIPGKPDINLATKHKARAVLRFICEQLKAAGTDEFYDEEMRDRFNAQFKGGSLGKRWKSDRFREDLFRGREAGFDLLFEPLDKAAGHYRVKILEAVQ